MKYCTKCGNQMNDDDIFCSKCGEKNKDILQEVSGSSDETEVESNGITETSQQAWDGRVAIQRSYEKKLRRRMFFIIVEFLIIIVLCYFLATSNTGVGAKVSNTLSSAVPSTEFEYSGQALGAGTYVVGEDLEPGSYNLKYQTTMSEDDYWALDYIWITHAGSDGKQETLGGTKFDERYGTFDYTQASSGAAVHLRLAKGDKICVDATNGSWTY